MARAWEGASRARGAARYDGGARSGVAWRVSVSVSIVTASCRGARSKHGRKEGKEGRKGESVGGRRPCRGVTRPGRVRHVPGGRGGMTRACASLYGWSGGLRAPRMANRGLAPLMGVEVCSAVLGRDRVSGGTGGRGRGRWVVVGLGVRHWASGRGQAPAIDRWEGGWGMCGGGCDGRMAVKHGAGRRRRVVGLARAGR